MTAEEMIELQSLMASQSEDIHSNGRISYIPSGYECISLEAAEFEEDNKVQPIHGCSYLHQHSDSHISESGGIYEYTDWWSDGECTHREE